MIVICPSCSARFQYDEARFQGVRSKRFRCPKCEHVFEVANPVLDVAPDPVPEPLVQSSDLVPPSVPAPNSNLATVMFDAAAHARQVAARQNGAAPVPPAPAPAPMPAPAFDPFPPAPSQPEPAPALTGQETTARQDRESFLASAGIRTAGIPSGMRFSLAYLSGPQASMVKVLENSQIMIGREEGDVITKDPETSRRHAMLEIHTDGTVWLTDLGSTNGTFVDDIQIFGTIQVSNRQEFTCGKSTFMLLIRKDDSLSLD